MTYSEHDFIPYTADTAMPGGRVLVLAPHPDDEVLGCGGAIMRHVAAGDPIRVVIVTDGALGLPPNTLDAALTRQCESQCAAAVMGYGEPFFWGLPDRGLAYDEDLVQRILEALDAQAADLVYAPSWWEMHPDHLTLAQATVEAVRRCPQPVRLAMYEVGIPLHPNRLLDITDLRERKQEAMDCFASQLAQQAYDRHIAALNVFRTYTLPAEVTSAEAYRLITRDELRKDPLCIMRPGHQDIELTILMPCLNESETIEMCIRDAREYLERQQVKGEILIADNGSTDGSQEIANKLNARIVDVPKKGYGSALRAGIDAANGRYIIMGDADHSYDFSNLNQFVEKLREGADLVMGNRFLGGIEKGAMPVLHRFLGNPVLSFIGRLFFKIEIGDFHCGLRGFSCGKMRALGLESEGMEFASEMVVRSSLADYSIVEVPTRLRPDGRSRPPHLRTWHDGWRHLRFLLLYSPRWLFLYPGLVLIMFGFFGSGLLLSGPVVIGGTTFDIHTLMATSFSLLIGLQLVAFSIVSKRIGVRRGYLPDNEKWQKFYTVNLEYALLIAFIIFLLGGAGASWSFAQWAYVSFGSLDYAATLRIFIFSLTLMMAGLQIGFTAFLGGIIDASIEKSRAKT